MLSTSELHKGIFFNFNIFNFGLLQFKFCLESFTLLKLWKRLHNLFRLPSNAHFPDFYSDCGLLGLKNLSNLMALEHLHTISYFICLVYARNSLLCELETSVYNIKG